MKEKWDFLLTDILFLRSSSVSFVVINRVAVNTIYICVYKHTHTYIRGTFKLLRVVKLFVKFVKSKLTEIFSFTYKPYILRLK